MKRLRVLLALVSVAVAAAACGSDPVATPDPRLAPRREMVSPHNDPADPCDPASVSGSVCQIMGSGT